MAAAIIIENKPKARNKFWLNDGPTAASVIILNLRITAKATGNKAPEKSAPIGAGALLYASGFQVCIGAKPTLVP